MEFSGLDVGPEENRTKYPLQTLNNIARRKIFKQGENSLPYRRRCVAAKLTESIRIAHGPSEARVDRSTQVKRECLCYLPYKILRSTSSLSKRFVASLYASLARGVPGQFRPR
jgi:hypothetical protein